MKTIDSPYTNAIVVLYNEGDYSLEKEIKVFPETVLDTTHIVREDDTLTSLANQYYGNGRYWHVIADKNDLLNINIFSLTVGSKLIIPSKESLQ